VARYRKRDGDLYQCNKCQLWLDAHAFYPLKTTKSGLHSWCKLCVKEANRQASADRRGAPKTEAGLIRRAAVPLNEYIDVIGLLRIFDEDIVKSNTTLAEMRAMIADDGLPSQEDMEAMIMPRTETNKEQNNGSTHRTV